MIIGLEQYKTKWNIQTDSAIHPGLEAITSVLEELGNPHKAGKFVHLAGTNGKGSTATFLSAILQAHQHSVGNFYSPCIENLHDQIQIDGKPVSSDELDLVMKQLSMVTTPLTDFELLTAAAFMIFRNHALDFTIIEAGMGGGLDSTNVIHPEIAIIPSISMDHTNFLGTTIEEIAWHKAGIIKKWKPVVVGKLPREALEIVQATANDLHAEVIQPQELATVQLKLKGPHQLVNASLALEAARELLGARFSEQKALQSLTSAHIAYRFEEVFPEVFFDGAHNKASAEALVETIKQLFPNRPIHIVMGVLKGKDYASVLRQLETVSDHFTFVDFDDSRVLPAEILFSENSSKRKTILNWYDILPVQDKEEVTIVTGSIYLLTVLRNSTSPFFQCYQS
ncbi:bifunctional folylpolyglutamate synthase/dihydrofolate synthase [Planococcus faecalis]|uniref:tetrahydrofolate synthase n=1 Tax=Planococcus faecalis TaxID=1598147 RepID=A0ABN4XH89_9BACL|nr:folylpolyglutamate synthase/dihydrofolate synthase family protein [Planococcus faecalis]AQU79046.1 bifunctional folylpolyglutamate synthase/dihydrofolate synthase [Planococcus faecalis]OHX51700.1 bifunctional folylpolyglutamate synthase/dihydrofolate synthase [Planococcus faecalis]